MVQVGLFVSKIAFKSSSNSNLKLDIDFNNPYDSAGLKLNDTSQNAAVLDAFGWANLAAIEAAREEKLSKF